MKQLIAVLCLIGLVHGSCEMRKVNSDCTDEITECITCRDMDACRTKCEEVGTCKGYTFESADKRCNLWMGTICNGTSNGINYYEKYCNGKESYVPDEVKKNIDGDDQEGPRRCPRIDPPQHGAHNMRYNTEGSLVQFFCDKGKTLVGSRTIECRSDLTWSDTAPICIQ